MKWVTYLEGLRGEARYLKLGTMGEWIAWAQIILNLLIDMLSSKTLCNIFVVEILAKQLDIIRNWGKCGLDEGFWTLALLTFYLDIPWL